VKKAITENIPDELPAVNQSPGLKDKDGGKPLTDEGF